MINIFKQSMNLSYVTYIKRILLTTTINIQSDTKRINILLMKVKCSLEWSFILGVLKITIKNTVTSRQRLLEDLLTYF